MAYDGQGVRKQRCAVYTRKSTDDRLERDFNSLESQRETCSAYIRSQRHKGWIELPDAYDDAAQPGGTLVRPALQTLVGDIERGLVDVVVIYKIDRLTRSLGDFIRLVDLFERYGVSFVSITQAFDTSDSMGRLVLNILLTFAQFEREMTADRIRDKVAAMKRRGKWTGGPPPLGYDVVDGRLVVNPEEAATVVHVFERYLALGSYVQLCRELRAHGMRTKQWMTRKGVVTGGRLASRGMIHGMLSCRFYVGDVPHFDAIYPGEHQPIVAREQWDRAQALLAERSMNKRIDGPSPNILLGLLFDAHGRRMTIADDSTHGRRYRYYISDQARWAVRQKVKRLRAEAGALEQLVIAALETFLCDRAQVRTALAGLGNAATEVDKLVENAPAAGKRLACARIDAKRLMLKALLARVEVSRDDVRLSLRCCEVENFLRWPGTGLFRRQEPRSHRDEPIHLVHVPAVAVRIERNLRLPIEPVPSDYRLAPAPGLISLLREARSAQVAVDANRTATLAEIGARFHRQPSFFARILRLNYLAPDIVTAILDGRQPAGLTRKRLVYASLPMDWAQQRKLLGFSAQPEIQGADERY